MNKEYFYEIAKKIYAIDSPSGFTNQIISMLKKECENLSLPYSVTKKGGLIIPISGKDDYKIGFSAHVDTLGAMVRSIKANGNLSFVPVGGPILNTFDGEYCKIYTRNHKTYTGTFLSTSPSIHVYKDATSKERNATNMEVRLDEMVKCKQDVEQLGIQNGDYIAIDTKTTFTENGFIKSRFLDDKISVAILFTLLHEIATKKLIPLHDLSFYISVYEEVGHGAAYPFSLDELIAIDMGCIGEDLKCSEYDVSICAKDGSGPYDYELVSSFISLAKEENLQYAVDIYPFYSSDVSAAYKAGNDIKGALIGPGIHASHGMERTHIQAIENTYQLIYSYIFKRG